MTAAGYTMKKEVQIDAMSSLEEGQEKTKAERRSHPSTWSRLFKLTCAVWLGFIAHVSTTGYYI